jgi:hypothetical protein
MGAPEGRELERRLTRLETIQKGERDRVAQLEGDVGALRQAAADLLLAVEVDRATRDEREKAALEAREKESKAERRTTKIVGAAVGLLVTVLEILRANGILG